MQRGVLGTSPLSLQTSATTKPPSSVCLVIGRGLNSQSTPAPTSLAGQVQHRDCGLSSRVRTLSASVHQSAPAVTPDRPQRPHDYRTGSSDNGMDPDSRTHRILSQPGIEGDPLKFLKLSEAYWKVFDPSKHLTASGVSAKVVWIAH